MLASKRQEFSTFGGYFCPTWKRFRFMEPSWIVPRVIDSSLFQVCESSFLTCLQWIAVLYFEYSSWLFSSLLRFCLEVDRSSGQLDTKPQVWLFSWLWHSWSSVGPERGHLCQAPWSGMLFLFTSSYHVTESLLGDVTPQMLGLMLLLDKELMTSGKGK